MSFSVGYPGRRRKFDTIPQSLSSPSDINFVDTLLWLVQCKTWIVGLDSVGLLRPDFEITNFKIYASFSPVQGFSTSGNGLDSRACDRVVCSRLLCRTFGTVKDQKTQSLVKLLETPWVEKVVINEIHARGSHNSGEYFNWFEGWKGNRVDVLYYFKGLWFI